MSKTKTGGPAFPNDPGTYLEDSGMSLRDYFAAKAMQGFASDPNCSWPKGVKDMARNAYCWADAMLEARSPGAPNDAAKPLDVLSV